MAGKHRTRQYAHARVAPPIPRSAAPSWPRRPQPTPAEQERAVALSAVAHALLDLDARIAAQEATA